MTTADIIRALREGDPTPDILDAAADRLAVAYTHDDPFRYGRVKIATIQAVKSDVRRLVQSEGTPELQAAWDRLEQWVDSPPMSAAPATGNERNDNA
jgi:hypothetical protein